jgi:transposase
VAIVQGTKSEDIITQLRKIPIDKRNGVSEVTLDMSNAMDKSVRDSFPNADIVTDRFHVQQIVTEAVQEIRIALRKQAIKEENEEILSIKEENKSLREQLGKDYEPKIYDPPRFTNGDTKKQILARSRYLLFKPSSKWTESQKKRAVILFKEYPTVKHAYNISMSFRSWYEKYKSKQEAKEGLLRWYEKVEEEKIEPFMLAAESIKAHEDTIRNYFNHRSTNASAESFNAKLKGFRTLVRGVRDVKFFLFRVAKLYG